MTKGKYLIRIIQCDNGWAICVNHTGAGDSLVIHRIAATAQDVCLQLVDIFKALEVAPNA